MLILSQKNNDTAHQPVSKKEKVGRVSRSAEVLVSSIALLGVVFPVGAQASVLNLLVCVSMLVCEDRRVEGGECRRSR